MSATVKMSIRYADETTRGADYTVCVCYLSFLEVAATFSVVNLGLQIFIELIKLRFTNLLLS